MHLHQLKIKNLASLRGEHEIDFDTLGAQDLFAITGETGAGKSTLLNAIALALYGKVYKTQLNQADLVTLGEREGSIELTLSLKGVRYLAQWSAVVRKKDGEPLAKPTTKRFFYEVPLAGEPRILETGPEDVLSLDFEQFSKCVVLNQGEFARFLTSSFADRRDILERLYPSDNLETVAGLARRKWDDVQQGLQRLEVQVHQLNEETLWDVEAAKARQTKLTAELGGVRERLKVLRPWAQSISDMKAYATKHAEARDRRTHVLNTLKERTDEYNLSLTRLQTAQSEFEKSEENFTRAKPKLDADQARFTALKTLSAQAQETTKRIQELTAQAERLKTRHTSVSGDVVTLELTLKELKAKAPERDYTVVDWGLWEKLEKNIPLEEQKQQSFTQNFQDLTTRGQRLGLEAEGLRKNQQDLLATFPSEWQVLSTEERGERLKSARAEITLALARASELKKLQAQEVELKKEIQQNDVLLLKAQNDLLKARVDALTALLKSHHPAECPVCQQAVSEKQWSALKAHWNEPRAEGSSTLAQLETAATRFTTQLQANLQRQAELVAEVTTLPLKDLGELEKLHESSVLLQVKIQQLDKQLGESRAQWKEAQELLHKLAAGISDLKLQRENILTTLGKAWGVTLTWTSTLFTETRQQFEVARLIKDKEAALKNLQTQATELQHDLAQTTQSLKTLSEKHLTEETLLNTEERYFAEHYPAQKPAELLKNLEEERRVRLNQVQVLQQEGRQKELLLGEARSNLARAEEQLTQLEVLFADVRSRMNATRPVQVEIMDAMSVLAGLELTVNAEIKEFESQENIWATELGQVTTLLSEDQKRREKKTALEGQQKLAQENAGRWKRLLEVLGNDDMRTYVLSLVEAALIQQTNIELDKLCAGRYEIQHNAKKGKLTPEFWIIDRWRDGLLRKVTTLSGGETFMVSLAMALALADMARGRADIDCFFIDEGFGTLDEDSLEDVMEMLQQVRSRGKQIGLITHVKALSERLPINLKVTKDARGNSQVGIVWN